MPQRVDQQFSEDKCSIVHERPSNPRSTEVSAQVSARNGDARQRIWQQYGPRHVPTPQFSEGPPAALLSRGSDPTRLLVVLVLG